MAKVSFKWDSTELDANLLALPPKVKERIRSRVRRASERGEKEMKAKAPWIDRTGNAREGLFADSHIETIGALTRYSLVFGHTVDYGIYLETMQNGRFQI